MAGQGNIVGEVYLNVIPKDTQFGAGVKSIIDRMESQATFKVSATGMEGIAQEANQIGQAFAQAAVQAGALVGAIALVKHTVEGTVNKFAGLFDQLAQAKAGFTAILHSEAAGGKLLDDIREFARVSPFVTQQLVNYSQQLLGVGLAANKIIPLLRSTGDIISAVGGDTQNLGRVLYALTQIKSLGRLQGQDAMQLQNSLIPITKYLAEYLHKTTGEILKMREAGQLTSDVVFAALNAQGEKVKGAMDRATRNISGAKAILSDTIVQMKQDQPVLNKIFDDMFKGIIKLSDFVGTAAFQEAFSMFFDGVQKIYEGLKPLFAELANVAGSGAITGLQTLGTALKAIGSVLDAIPDFALEWLVRLFTALALLKAPLMLIKYATTMKTLALAVIPTTGGLRGMSAAQEKAAFSANLAARAVMGETSALNANSIALKFNAAALAQNASAAYRRPGQMSPYIPGGPAEKPGLFTRAKDRIGGTTKGNVGMGLAIGSTIIGGYLSQSDATATQAIGGALTGAGTGAMIGSMFAPGVGTAIGAAAGLAIGGLTSYFSAVEAKAKKHVEEMTKLGKEAAAKFIQEEEDKFGSAASAELFEALVKDRQKAIDALAEGKNTPKSTTLTIEEVMVQNPTFTVNQADDFITAQGGNQNRDSVPVLDKGQQALLEAQIKDFDSDLAARREPIQNAVNAIVESLDVGTDGFKAFTQSAGDSLSGIAVPLNLLSAKDGVKNVHELQASLEHYGLTLADIGDPDKREGSLAIIKMFDGLTEAQERATLSANKYNAAHKIALEASAAVHDPISKEIEAEISQIEARNTALSGAISLGKAAGNATPEHPVSRLDELKQLDVVEKFKEAARAKQATADELERTALLQRLTLEHQGQGHDKDGMDNTFIADKISAFNAQAALNQETAAKTAAALATDLFNTSQWATVEATKAVTKENLIATESFLKLTDSVTNRNIVEQITNKLTEQAKKDLEDAKIRQSDIQNQPGVTIDQAVAARDAVDKLTRRLEILAHDGIAPTAEEQEWLNEAFREGVDAMEAMIPPLQAFTDRYAKIKGFNSALAGLFDFDKDSGIAKLTGDLDDVAAVVNTIAQDTNAAYSGLIGAGSPEEKILAQAAADRVLWGELETLQRMLGWSEEKFNAFLDSMNISEPVIDGVTGTMGELADAAGVSVEKFAELVGWQGKVQRNIIMTVTADVQAAIDELIRLDLAARTVTGSLFQATQAGTPYGDLYKAADEKVNGDGITFGGTPANQDKSGAAKKDTTEDKVRAATEALADKLRAAAEAIAEAAQQWVGSIKERTQYEMSVSAGTATRNANRQTKDLTEIFTGMNMLRAKGLSEEAIKSLSIDNVSDVKQVRKLLKASSGDLAALSSAVAARDEAATVLATSEEDKNTRKNITEGILDAAKQLDLNVDKADAETLGANFNISTTSNADEVAAAILKALTSGFVAR